jgi:hypothetical protein
LALLLIGSARAGLAAMEIAAMAAATAASLRVKGIGSP